MKLITQSIKTKHRSEMIDVTDRVAKAVRDAGVADGVAIVYVPHTTPCVAQLPPDIASA